MSDWDIKRKSPYTETGIKRKKCIRCGRKAVFQWEICADYNFWRPICLECDYELNKVVLDFMKCPNKEKLMSEYKRYLNI